MTKLELAAMWRVSRISFRRFVAALSVLALLCFLGTRAAPAEATHSQARTRANPGGCSVPEAKFAGRVLVEGVGNIKATAEDCRLACQHNTECNAWTWCADVDTCLDEHLRRIPYRGCQLKTETQQPAGLPSDEYVRKFRPSTLASGYVKRHKERQETFIRVHSAPMTKLMIVTSVPPHGCTHPKGDFNSLLSILNKQDYARWHSYEFHVSTRATEPSLRPAGSPDAWAWDKVAQMVKVLDETPPEQAEWILFMQPDTVIDDVAFTFPFEFYQGKDFVALGDGSKLLAGDPTGIDMGVFLVRNSPFIKGLFAELAKRAVRLPVPSKDTAFYPDPLSVAMAEMVADSPDKYLEKLNFRSEICISCDWRRIDLLASTKVEVTKAWGNANKRWNLFISRFFDCPMCSASDSDPDGVNACHNSFLEHYEFSYCRFHKMEQATSREAELGGAMQHLAELGVDEADLRAYGADSVARTHNTVRQAAKTHHTSTAQECWSRCAKDGKCEMWVWCGHKAGCDDAGEFNGIYPYHGCQLMQLPKGVEPRMWDRGPVFSSFESGYIHRNAKGKIGSRQGTGERIAILTGVPTSPCTNPYGDYFLGISLRNKQDYARLHGYELHLMAESVDSTIRAGPWQKVALLHQALEGIPAERADWILWLDMDLLVANMNFTFPIEKYAGKDMILHGDMDYIKKGDARKGMNSGVLLLRNNDWTRNVMDDMMHYGRQPVNFTLEEELRAGLPSYEVGLYEQNVLTYLFYTRNALMDRVYFDTSEYGINCWWKDVDSPHVAKPAFIVHFAGCSMCSGFHADRLGDCDAQFLKTYAEAFGRLSKVAPHLQLS